MLLVSLSYDLACASKSSHPNQNNYVLIAEIRHENDVCSNTDKQAH